MLGWFKQVLLNPSILSNLYALKTQYLEFTNSISRKRLLRQHHIIAIHPYFKYEHWEEARIEKVLTEDLQWKMLNGVKSTCLVGCEVDTLRQYLYQRILKYNDKNVTISEMIRDGQITRESALAKLESERQVPREMIKSIIDKIGLNADEFMRKLDKKYPEE